MKRTINDILVSEEDNNKGKGDLYLLKNLNPEEEASVTAMYSRSKLGIKHELHRLLHNPKKTFMQQYYVGFNDKSIGDSAYLTFCIEGVSLTTAKVFQDNVLYNGIEMSTRYVSLSGEGIKQPDDLKDWLSFYETGVDLLCEEYRAKYRYTKGMDEKQYNNAINAKALDVMRGFLPAGVLTNVSWTVNFRQMYDKCIILQDHPLADIRELATRLLSLARSIYPGSFCHHATLDYSEYIRSKGEALFYRDTQYIGDDKVRSVDNTQEVKKEHKELLSGRKSGYPVPQFFSQYGMVNFTFEIDYGCFRDIQRHRNGVCRLPILTTELGMHEWYLNELPEVLISDYNKLEYQLWGKVKGDLTNLSKLERQRYIPIGFKVPVELSYSIGQCIYVIELRSGVSVHPILRDIIHKMDEHVSRYFPWAPIHCNREVVDFNIRRGNQNIERVI